MASPRRLRDQFSNNFSPHPTRQGGRGATKTNTSRKKMEACGATVAAMMKSTEQRPVSELLGEPLRNVSQFLASQPSAQIIADVLNQYRAFVLELSSMANDRRPEENQWRYNMSSRAKLLAEKKFKHLKPTNQNLQQLLEAYRGAVMKLDHALRQQRSSINVATRKSSEDTERSTTNSSFMEVRKIVSSGMGLLFGESTNSSDGTGWVSLITINY